MVLEVIKRYDCKIVPRSSHTDLAQKVNHAGYQRYILERNPKRYNEYGNELEDSESDPEADADAEEQNPYGEIKLEGTKNYQIRCPGSDH